MTAAAIAGNGLREIRLYGVLGRKFGRVHRLAVGSVREAMRALAVVVPGFGQHLIEHSEPGYQVFIGKRGQNPIGLDRLEAPVGQREPICVVPVVAGAKRGGVGQIILGAALLFLAPYAAGFLFGTGTALGTASAIAIAKFSGTIAASLILGGVVQLVAGQRTGSPEPRPEGMPSYNFDGVVNTTQEGLPVPLRYGRVLCGGAVISAGIMTEDLVSTAIVEVPMPLQPLPANEPTNPIEESENWVGGA